jgi:hypothetical protein
MTQPDKIRNLKDYFVVLRERPGMFLGKNTITKLHDHLLGYRTAMSIAGVIDPSDDHFFKNFHDFVCTYYDVKVNSGWNTLILDQCFNDEEEALARFFELYDLFVTDTKIISSKKIVMTLFESIVNNQTKLKESLGENFATILEETFDLIKDNAITNSKQDFDYILDQLTMRAEVDPDLNKLLSEIKQQEK